METNNKPKVAIYKFSSCSGCQQALFNTGNELPEIFEALDIIYFVEGQSTNERGPYDLALVEGSISRSEEIDAVKELRAQAKFLIAMGACAIYGGPQALRDWTNTERLREIAYERPDEVKTLDWTGGIDAYITVDYRVPGCAPNPKQLIEVITNFLQGKRPSLPQHSVCIECKMTGNVCLLVAGGLNCMGPVTVAGCGAACPSNKRGCYGCFGPMNAPNAFALARVFEKLGNSAEDIVRIFRNQNSNASSFREVARAYAQKR